MSSPFAFRFSGAAALLAAAVATAPAAAHGDGAPSGWAWNTDPAPALAIVGLGALYAGGLARLWRGGAMGRGVSRRHAGAFFAGLAALAAALVSPIDTLADELASVHMTQHMLLMMVAAPLLVLGSPVVVWLWALPERPRTAAAAVVRRVNSWRVPAYLLWQPAATWGLFAVTLWVWHLPRLYGAALRDPLVHDAQHVAFLAAACLFWRVLLDPLSRLRLSPGLGVLYLFTSSLHATALGVFMALSPRLWYPHYAGTAPARGIAAIEDQQLAGFIMWMPACMIYAVAAALIFGLWLHDAGRARGNGHQGPGGAAGRPPEPVRAAPGP